MVNKKERPRLERAGELLPRKKVKTCPVCGEVFYIDECGPEAYERHYREAHNRRTVYQEPTVLSGGQNFAPKPVPTDREQPPVAEKAARPGRRKKSEPDFEIAD